MSVPPGSLDLVGRSAELRQLIDVIERTSGDVALLAGEPGIGKTRLLNEALRRAGSTPLIGISSPASLGRPFDLLLSAVEPMVRWWSAPPAALTAVGDALGQLLRSVAPGLVLDDSSVTAASGELIGAGIALLRHLDPELLILEDIHWADIESLQVVERLLASPDRPTLIATYRPEELVVGRPAGELIRMIESRHSPIHLHLEPFGPAEIRMYVQAALRDDPDRRTLERLRLRTGGNPFFLEQLLHRGAGETLELRESTLPWTLTETIRHHLDALAPDERELLALAAILGSPFEFDLLAAVTDGSEADLVERVRSVVERGVLVEEELDLFRFRHELVPESIIDSLLGRERRRLHDRAFVALQSVRPHDYAELARHARGAGRIGDLVILAPQGVQHYLAAGSTYQALVLAEAALDELPNHPQLCELAARAAWLIGRLDTARRHAERWRSVAEREEPERETDALALLARIAFETGDVDTQQRIMDELDCRVQGQPDGPSRAKLLAVIAQHRMLIGDSAAAIATADEAIAIADRLDLPDVRRRALVERGSARMSLDDDAAEALIDLEAIANESELAGDYVAAARAWHNLGSAQSPEDAERSLQRMREAAVRCGFDSMAIQYYAVRKVELARRRGDLADARQWAGRSRLFGRDSRTGFELARVDAMLALEAGDDEDARSITVELATIQVGSGRGRSDVNWVLALQMVDSARSGDRDATIDMLGAFEDDPELPVIIAWALRDLVAVGVDGDDLAPVARQIGAQPDVAITRAALALIAAIGSGDATEGRLRDALEQPFHCAIDRCHPEQNAVLISAELHLAIARIAVAEGRVEDCRDHAVAAAALLAAWPGGRRAEALALASHGRGGLDGESALTGRELDVARLLARGLSNGQIAEELFIARKTVSTHVSNILAKLDMRSRTEIASWAIQHGLAESTAAAHDIAAG